MAAPGPQSVMSPAPTRIADGVVLIREVAQFRKAFSPAVVALFLAAMPSVIVNAHPQSQEPASPPSAAPAQTPSKPEQPTSTRGFRWKDHPTLQLGADTEIAFRARLQAHVRESDATVGDARSFDLSRRRIGVEGRILGAVDFQIERELDDNDPWRDVYVDYRSFDAVQVQAGKFKLPFSLDENTSAINLDFVYRSRAATQLAPGRDRGVMVHGRLLNRMVGYQAGVFEHDGANARSRNPEVTSGDRTWAGRLTVQPFRAHKSVFRDVQLGVAGTTSVVPEGINGLRGRTALDAAFFEPDLWVQGRRRRAGLELRWRPGPWSLKAEYMRVTTERREQSVEDTDLSPLVATGWYISSTYLVTGERKTTGPDAPRRPLLRGGWGALELAARIERLGFASRPTGDGPSLSPRTEAILPSTDRVTTFGVNWVPIRGVKLQANVVHEALTDPVHGPLPSRPAFWSRVLRFQIAL
jgi:phosphate-selective porin OprO and OprP